MEKIIEIPDRLKIKEKKIIYEPLVKIYTSENVEVKSIAQVGELLKIDFIYHACSKHINGGWVQISSETFIRPTGSKERLKMVSAENIPIAPNKHYFKSASDKLHYSLYFPAVGKEVDFIDIIEKEQNEDFFNFYGVAINKIVESPIVITNMQWTHGNN